MDNTYKFNLYIPLLIHVNKQGEPYNFLCELEETDGTEYESEIRTALEEFMKSYPKSGLADRIYGKTGNKVVSAVPDVIESNGELFGVMKFESTDELKPLDKSLLEFWTIEEMAGEWGTAFEKIPIIADNEEVYVSFYNDEYSYEIETEETFFDKSENQGMQIS